MKLSRRLSSMGVVWIPKQYLSQLRWQYCTPLYIIISENGLYIHEKDYRHYTGYFTRMRKGQAFTIPAELRHQLEWNGNLSLDLEITNDNGLLIRKHII